MIEAHHRPMIVRGLILGLACVVIWRYAFANHRNSFFFTTYTTSSFDDTRRRGIRRQRHLSVTTKQSSATNETLIHNQHHRQLYNRSLLFANSIQFDHTTYKIPHVLESNLLNWDADIDINNDQRPSGIPIFWHILKSGGTTIKLMYQQCYHLVEACESGVLENDWVHNSPDSPNQEPKQVSDSAQHLDDLKAQNSDFLNPLEWVQQQHQKQLDDNSDANWQQRRRLQAVEETTPGHLEGSILSAPLETVQKQEELHIFTARDGRKYVDVDVTTYDGILSANNRGFATSNLADVIFTPLFLEGAEYLLNNNSNRGRMFTLFRHPIDRVVSIFYYLKTATWEPTFNKLFEQWTIDEYVKSQYVESNWMVRSLIGQMTGPLSPGALDTAKEVLRRKCLVGFMSKMEESIIRFHKYFKFGMHHDDALQCAIQTFVKDGGSKQVIHSEYAVQGGSTASNKSKYPKLNDENSETYIILAATNSLDIQLYEYAIELFDEQGKLLFGGSTNG